MTANGDSESHWQAGQWALRPTPTQTRGRPRRPTLARANRRPAGGGSPRPAQRQGRHGTSESAPVPCQGLRSGLRSDSERSDAGESDSPGWLRGQPRDAAAAAGLGVPVTRAGVPRREASATGPGRYGHRDRDRGGGTRRSTNLNPAGAARAARNSYRMRPAPGERLPPGLRRDARRETRGARARSQPARAGLGPTRSPSRVSPARCRLRCDSDGIRTALPARAGPGPGGLQSPAHRAMDRDIGPPDPLGPRRVTRAPPLWGGGAVAARVS